MLIWQVLLIKMILISFGHFASAMSAGQEQTISRQKGKECYQFRCRNYLNKL